MHMLPTKDGLILKVCGDDPSLQEEAERTFHQAIECMKKVFEKTQLVYEENNVLDLPWDSYFNDFCYSQLFSL